MKSNLMTEKQAAKFLGLGTQTLRNWRHLVKGPKYIKMGRAIRYNIEDLEEFIQSRKKDPESFLEKPLWD